MSLAKPRGMRPKEWVRTQRNRNLDWVRCVAEWIDNSIGNGATHVTVKWRPKMVEIIDNGYGCTDSMFAAMVSPYWHEENEDTVNTVSRYGIGAKDGFLWCQGITECFSRRVGQCFYIAEDWDSLGDDWSDLGTITDGDAAEHRCERVGLFGDGVLIQQRHNRQMNVAIFDRVRKQLTSLYWAAIETGVQIDIRFQPQGSKKARGGLLPGSPMPEFAEGFYIDEDLQLANERRIRIKGGVLEKTVRLSNPGFEYIYGHRVVIKAGGIGSGGMDFERVYFRVFLLGDKQLWNVTTNKDRLDDADEAMLEQAVFDRCKPLLEVCAQADWLSYLDQELLDDLSESLTEAHRKHARRAPGEKTGTVKPADTGNEHSFARRTHDRDGKYRTKRGPTGNIIVRKVEFEDKDKDLVGRASVRDRIVRLNSLQPYIGAAFERKDRNALFVVAMALWSEQWMFEDSNGQTYNIPRVEFVPKLSAMLSIDKSVSEHEA